MNEPRMLLVLLGCAGLAGCATVPNQYREDGPSTRMPHDSPTAMLVKQEHEAAPMRNRGWDETTATADNGVVTHGPLYMQDPFVDKGAGRSGDDVYRLGWEDWVAMPYSYARYTLNWLMIPVSAVVEPPWKVMESDGQISKQALGYDHDAVGTDRDPFQPEAE